LSYKLCEVLLEEPLGALDKEFRYYMQIEIKRIQKEVGITVIYVTHDQEEALNISDRIAVMNTGKIEQVDSPRGIYENPKNRFVADFIGEANIIEGKVSILEGSLARVSIWNHLDVKALNLNLKAPETLVSVVIRPERIKLLIGNGKADNDYLGTILEANFVGQLVRYTIAVENGGKLFLKEYNQGQTIHSPGQKIRFGWNNEDALII